MMKHLEFNFTYIKILTLESNIFSIELDYQMSKKDFVSLKYFEIKNLKLPTEKFFNVFL